MEIQSEASKTSDKLFLPLDWREDQLKKLLDSKRSIRYGIVQPGDFDPNGRYMVRGQDYSFGWVSPENLFRVSEPVEIRYKNARLKAGDIILTIVGAGTGTVSIIPEWLEGANCTQTTARIAIDPTKADSHYCYHFLQSFHGQKLTYKNIKGGAQPGLNCGDIEKYLIILPPLSEQKAIAKVLGAMDKAINAYCPKRVS
jgi:type I restriction enzyme S subunit